MKSIKMYGKQSILLMALFAMITFVACGDEEDDVNTGDPTASFQYAVDEVDFLKVTFTNFSQNAAEYTWDFGDGGTSTEESPVHTYAESGTFAVTLTIANASGTTDDKTESVSVFDPAEATKLLTGEESRTWRLIREPDSVSMAQLGTAGFWAGNKNDDGSRPCVYKQSFTFKADGDFIIDDAGYMWGEWFEFQGDDRQETCIDVSGGTLEVGGNDVSAWLSGTHQFTYDPAAGELTLTGEGAWLGVPALGTIARDALNALSSSKTMNVKIVEYPEAGYDVMTVSYDWTAENQLWQFTYASYYNAADEPAVVEEEPACVALDAVAPTEISHSFASNDAADWVLMQPIESGSGIELGSDDPADANAAKVGKFLRTTAVNQELKFNLDPINAIDFTNLTTITIDVYLPSTNTYGEGALTKKVAIGFAGTKCLANWWEDIHVYETAELATDEWVAVTLMLDSPGWVAVPANGAKVYDRNDLDMFYIQIGGGGHAQDGTFYVRNFSIK